jgi:hypothetical protein
MASIRDAIATYKPEIDLEDPLDPEELLDFLAEKSDLEHQQVQKVLAALGESAFWFLVRARPLPLPSVGSLRPTIDLEGKFGIAVDIDPALQAQMGEPEAFRAGINRRENIGLSFARLAQMWNSANPDDPVRDFEAYGLSGAP